MKNAIDLFGGKQAVLGRLAEQLRAKLQDKSWNEMKQIEQALRLPARTLERILSNTNAEVDYLLFDAVAPLLELSVDEVLGQPDLAGAEDQKYWTEEMKRSPLLLVGAMGGGGLNTSGSNEVGSVGLYVMQRAIEELNSWAMSDTTGEIKADVPTS